MEYQIKIEDRKILVKKNKTDFQIDDKCTPYKIEKQGDCYFLYSEDSLSTVRVIERDGHTLLLEVNGKIVDVNIKDSTAMMLEKLGIDNTVVSLINEVKAPMPGVIMTILVEEGQEIKKGDPLLVLEAMKMENLIKSPTDARVTTIKIEKGQSVEKNETLISFD